MMLLIIGFRQNLGNQYEQNHQMLYFVDVIVIKEVACNSKWIAGLRNVENILILSNTMRLQVLHDFAVDMVGLIAIGELLIYLVCDLCF